MTRFLNVRHGIIVETEGENNLIEGNVVENFSGDGMRGLGNYNRFEYNTVMNCYDVDDNHDDGFQSYSRGPSGVGTGTVYGIELRGNTIINYLDPDQPLRGTLQGIGCFDGMFEDWVVENNVIITDHWHGITLLGATNCRIINNTVVDRNSASPGPPWISIEKDKDGTLSTGNSIRNNLTTSMNNDGGIGVVEYNITVGNYDTYFVDYANLDLRLKEGCPAIDAGTGTDAPSIDIDGNIRPQGGGWDVGAYEFPSVPDTVPPLVLTVTSIRPNEIEVSFNEQLDETTSQDETNYSVDHELIITSAILGPDSKSVVLTSSGLSEGITYTLTVHGIKDKTGNTIETHSEIQFEHICGYVTASDAQAPNYPENTMDGDLSTRWSASGVQWIEYDLCVIHLISAVGMAFHYGNTRTANFRIEVSNDHEMWTEVFNGSSSGTTLALETFDFSDLYGRWVKITGSGNSASSWNSYTEVSIDAEELIISRLQLQELIDSALYIHENAEEGAEPGQYQEGSKADLYAAIDSVTQVHDDHEAGRWELGHAYVLLLQALEVFEENRLTDVQAGILSRIRVYPNPADHHIRIHIPVGLEIRSIRISDLLGSSVQKTQDQGSRSWNLEHLAPGIYLVRVHTDRGTRHIKLFKR
jgi:hypothetical protein